MPSLLVLGLSHCARHAGKRNINRHGASRLVGGDAETHKKWRGNAFSYRTLAVIAFTHAVSLTFSRLFGFRAQKTGQKMGLAKHDSTTAIIAVTCLALKIFVIRYRTRPLLCGPRVHVVGHMPPTVLEGTALEWKHRVSSHQPPTYS